MTIRKPQTVSRRAANFAQANCKFIYDESRIQSDANCWAAGYRAAMRDVRRILSELGPDATENFINDTERLK